MQFGGFQNLGIACTPITESRMDMEIMNTIETGNGLGLGALKVLEISVKGQGAAVHLFIRGIFEHL